MPRVYAFIHSGFKKAAEKAVEWLGRLRYESLFLELPEDFTPYVIGYMDERLSLDELWRSYEYLTGFKQPYVNALKYGIGSVLKALRELKLKTPEMEVYCYLDLKYHLDNNRLTEKTVLLEAVERVRNGVKVDEWRNLLTEEHENSMKGWKRVTETLSELLRLNEENIIFYSGFTRPLKEYLREEGFKFNPIYLQRYWKPPLEALKTLIWINGINNIPDDVIVSSIKNQLKYLDHVLSSENIDEAHEEWTRETHRMLQRPIQ